VTVHRGLKATLVGLAVVAAVLVPDLARADVVLNYIVVMRGSNLCLTASSLTVNASVSASACTSSSNQVWQFGASGSMIAPANATNLCLDTPGGSPVAGAALVLRTCNTQEWFLYPPSASAGGQLVPYSAANLCVDGASTTSGGPATLIACASTAPTQQWDRATFQRANSAPLEPSVSGPSAYGVLTMTDNAVYENSFAWYEAVDSGGFSPVRTRGPLAGINGIDSLDLTTLGNVSTGHTYAFFVTVTNSYGTNQSSTVSVSPHVPNTPSGVTVTNLTDTEADLKWTDNSSDELGFRVHDDTNNVDYTYPANYTGTTAISGRYGWGDTCFEVAAYNIWGTSPTSMGCFFRE
jgi:hypothetical protein